MENIKFWSELEIIDLNRLYPDNGNKYLTEYFGRSKVSIRNKAIRLWIKKSEVYLSSNQSIQNLWESRVRKWNNHHLYWIWHSELSKQKIKDKHFVMDIHIQETLHKHRRFNKWEKEVYDVLTKMWVDFIYQHWMWNFVLDFYIPSKKLCIEVDWRDHSSKKKLDAMKDKFLIEEWILVSRVLNYKDIPEQIKRLF